MQTITDTNLSEKTLVKRILKGETDAYTIFVRQTERLVYQIVNRMVDDTEERKDIVQEVYANAFVYLPKFRFDSRLATWIGRIAYNACLAYLKRKKQRPEGTLLEGTNQELTSETFGRIDSKQLSIFLLAAIDQLPPVHKTLIVLYHQEELDYLEIGRITGLPQGTVKSYLFRARRQLKQLLTIRYKSGDL